MYCNQVISLKKGESTQRANIFTYSLSGRLSIMERKKVLTKAQVLKRDQENVQPVRSSVKEATQQVTYSTRLKQLQMIKKIMLDENEKKAFNANPKKYLTDKKIMISDETVQEVLNAVLFDTVLDDEIVKKYTPKELESLVEMREAGRLYPLPKDPNDPKGITVDPIGPKAIAPAVAAGAAVVVAAAAVATAVVTMTRASKLGRLTPIQKDKLQGLGKEIKPSQIKRGK